MKRASVPNSVASTRAINFATGSRTRARIWELMEAAHLSKARPHSAIGTARARARRSASSFLFRGEAEDIVAALLTQQIQHFRSAVVAVAAHQNVNAGANDWRMRRMTCRSTLRDLLPRRPFAGSEQRQDRLARACLENMDRLEAMCTRVRIEQRQLLLAVHQIVGVVDVEHDATSADARSCGRRDRSSRSRSGTASPASARFSSRDIVGWLIMSSTALRRTADRRSSARDRWRSASTSSPSS